MPPTEVREFLLHSVQIFTHTSFDFVLITFWKDGSDLCIDCLTVLKKLNFFFSLYVEYRV